MNIWTVLYIWTVEYMERFRKINYLIGVNFIVL